MLQTPHHHPDDLASPCHAHAGHGHEHQGPGPLETVLAADPGLSYHGDAELAPGLVDLAVNVRRDEPPEWLRAELAQTLGELAAYPDPALASQAVAARHGRGTGRAAGTERPVVYKFAALLKWPSRCPDDRVRDGVIRSALV